MKRKSILTTSYRFLFLAFGILISMSSQAGDRGKMQFGLCMSCHGKNAEGRKELAAPAIAGLPEWYIVTQLKNFKEGVRGKHPKDIAGMRMAPMARSLKVEGDLEAVAQYVSKLPVVTKAEPVKGDIQKGQVLYVTCQACHGANGEGMEVMGAPPIAQMDPWYMATQLKHFKAGIRGANPKDAKGMTMAPMAQTLVDDQAIEDVIAYIKSLKK